MKRYLLFVDLPYSFGILRPLQESIRRRGYEASWYVVREKDRGLLGPDERLLPTIAAVRDYAPRAVFSPGNYIPHFFPGAKVMVFHGLGPVGKRGHYRIRGFYDLYCVPGPSEAAKFRELARRHGHFAVAETGWIKLDPLFRDGARRRLAGERPRILYAPTFSPSVTSAPALLDEIQRLAAERGWSWCVKFHDKMDPKWVAGYRALEGPGLRIERDPDLHAVLRRCDVVVSDTSSVVHESLILDIPVVTYRTRNPGDHVRDIRDARELEEAILKALERSEPDLARSRAYVDAIHPYRDGRSSERVLDATEEFIRAGSGTLRPKPWNILRRLMIRRRMVYYGS